jgi:hypothetical protein
MVACRDNTDNGGGNEHFFIRKCHILARTKVTGILNGRATANASKKLNVQAISRPLFERRSRSLDHLAG